MESHLGARCSRSRTRQPPRRCKASTTISINKEVKAYNPTSQGPSFLVWRQETKGMMLIDLEIDFGLISVIHNDLLVLSLSKILKFRCLKYQQNPTVVSEHRVYV